MPPTDAMPLEEQARMELAEELAQAVAEIAAELGPAPGTRTVSRAREIALWGQTDPQVDYDALYTALTTVGLGQTPELLDPENKDALMIVQENPQIAPMYAEPVEPDLAEALATLAEYPFRLSILMPLQGDPEAMVAAAERLDRAWRKTLGEDDEDGAPVAPAPPPPDDSTTAAAPAPEPALARGGY